MAKQDSKPPKVTHPKKRAFLAAYVESMGNVSAACRAIGIERTLVRWWLAHDPVFAAAREDARRVAGDKLKAFAIKLATVGVQEYVLYDGKPVIDPGDPENKRPLVKTTYPTTLLIFLMKHLGFNELGERELGAGASSANAISEQDMIEASMRAMTGRNDDAVPDDAE